MYKRQEKGKAKAATEARRILHVIQDRFRFAGTERERVMEALDTALRMGAGHLAVYVMDAEGANAHTWKFSDRDVYKRQACGRCWRAACRCASARARSTARPSRCRASPCRRAAR